jgi:hypothetical protein
MTRREYIRHAPTTFIPEQPFHIRTLEGSAINYDPNAKRQADSVDVFLCDNRGRTLVTLEGGRHAAKLSIRRVRLHRTAKELMARWGYTGTMNEMVRSRIETSDPVCNTPTRPSREHHPPALTHTP